MEIDTSLIGASTAPYVIAVERGEIRRFAQAIGDSNPLWLDRDFARSHGYDDVIAPPTFPVSFQMPGIPIWWEGLDRKRFLAGEHRFSYVRPIGVGDVLTCRMTLTDVEHKEGRSGRMDLMLQEVRGVDQGGAEVFSHRRITVYRGAGNALRGS
ncbi:MAG: MaoC family dehydratase N-terminal domain-containing protein [Pseudodonghicola sp.]|nr:MaoC family dehydratase N-terminal domain-containing protein [Pseudodonghicola sp.]